MPPFAAPRSIHLSALTALVVLTGCTAPSPTRGGFQSSAPAARTHAVEETVKRARATGTIDRTDLQSMVELLLADDALVRFMAIAALEQLEGDALGYRFFDPGEVRYRGALRWREFALTAKRIGSTTILPPPEALVDDDASEGGEPG